MLVHTMNPHGILMLNLSISKDIQGQTYRKLHGMDTSFDMKNTAYYCPYDFADNKVNAIYIVYKIRDYDGGGAEHNYLFWNGR